MKKSKFRRITSMALASMMVFSLMLSSFSTVYAADSPPMSGAQARKANQPKFSGYRIWDIRDWSPEEDPGAEFLRAEVPLQQRINPFKPTQANPSLETEAEIMLMQGDYGNAFVDGMMYNNTFSYHTLNYWQYVDYFSPWHGAATANTPEDLHDWNYENTADRGWEKRYFEFGILNIPNPAYTNAAHRNGVKSIACIYFDQYYRPGQTIDELYIQDEDGTFPVAEKLIEMAEYFGYDGYFFNCEETTSNPEGQKKFLARLAKSGLYTQYYDTNSAMNEAKYKWLSTEIDGVETKLQDSVFVNYGWPGNLDRAGINFDYITQKGLNPFKQVFYGVEANQGKFSGSHSSAKNVPQLYAPGTKNLRASVALFTPSDYYQRSLPDDLGLNGRIIEDNDYQWMIAERERMYFSGVKSDPTKTGLQTGYARPEVGVKNGSGWVGVADFASERSVIGGSTFYSRFNTGKGLQYFTNGKVSSDEEWSNINIQSILPSWQWWIEVPQKADPENPESTIDAGAKLAVDFDYGEKYFTGAYDYTKVGGYNGGSSLVVAGNLEVQNYLRLFKTELSVKDNSKLSITYNKPSASDGTEMKLGVILKDAPNKVEYIAIPGSGTKTSGWVTKEVDLSAFSGKEIATIGLAFNPKQGAVANYQINIGEIKVTDGSNHTPAQPTGFKVDRMFASDELIVKWNLDDFNVVDNYELYATLSDGQRLFLGGIYDNIYYIKSLLNEKEVVELELYAIGKDGSMSAPATVKYDFTNKVSNIKVSEEKKEIIIKPDAVVKGSMYQSSQLGALNVSWTNPTTDYKNLELVVTMDDSKDTAVFTKTVAKGVTETQIVIPRGHGEKYNLAIKTVLNDGTVTEAINVTGKLKDAYVAPYNPSLVTIKGKNATFWCPDPNDWFKIHVTVNGQVVTFKNAFGWTANNAIRAGTTMKTTLPYDSGVMKIVLEDYAGNFSQPTIIPYFANATAELTSEIIPDAALLEAIKTQAGTTVKEASEFKGKLDLSGLAIKDITGLNLLVSAKEIDLSNTQITELVAGSLVGAAEKLNLSNIETLSLIADGAVSGLTNLKELDITGSNNIRVLDLSDSTLEKLTYQNAEAFSKLQFVDLSNARFDLSNGTPEKQFVEAAKNIVKGKGDYVIIDEEVSNLAIGATISSLSTIDGQNLIDGNTGNYSYATPGSYLVLEYASPQIITNYSVLPYSSSYSPDGVKVYTSNDGENFTLVSEIDGKSSEYKGEIENPAPAKFIKVQFGVNTGGYIKEVSLFGNRQVVYSESVTANNQRPVAYTTELPKTIDVKQQEGTFDITSILKAQTIRGTDVAKLVDADFVAEDYDINAQILNSSTMIQLTDKTGNVVAVDTIDTSKANTYKVQFVDFNDADTTGKVINTTTIKVGTGGTVTPGPNPDPDPNPGTNPDLEKPQPEIPNNTLIEEIKNGNSQQVKVAITKPDVVDSEVFKALKGKDKTVTFDVVDSNGKVLYSFTFNGKDITNTKAVNLQLVTSTPNAKISKLLKDKNPLVLSFTHEGQLPGNTSVKIFVGEQYKDGEQLFLYYYNAKTNQLEFKAEGLKVKDGYVVINISHCSDYVLTTAKQTIQTSNPQTGDTNKTPMFPIALLVLSGLTLACFVGFSNKKRPINQ